MDILLNADDDWIENTRLYLYPKLHPPLSSIGETIGIPLYAVGHVGENQFVGVLDEDEETIEQELDDRGQRNPFACLKELSDGRVSEGSWVFLHADNPELVEEGMQLHVTLFDPQGGGRGREVYAHYEDDWRASPIAHLRGKNFSAEQGVEKAETLLNENSLLVLR